MLFTVELPTNLRASHFFRSEKSKETVASNRRVNTHQNKLSIPYYIRLQLSIANLRLPSYAFPLSTPRHSLPLPSCDPGRRLCESRRPVSRTEISRPTAQAGADRR